MRNNRQDLLTLIRIDISLLKFDDNKLIDLFGKTYKQILKMNYEDLKTVRKSLKYIKERRIEK